MPTIEQELKAAVQMLGAIKKETDTAAVTSLFKAKSTIDTIKALLGNTLGFSFANLAAAVKASSATCPACGADNPAKDSTCQICGNTAKPIEMSTPAKKPASTASAKTLTRAQLNKLDPAAKTAFFKDGGKLTD